MIRVAAVGDVHLAGNACGHLRPALEEMPRIADVLLTAGDLTRHGTVDETECAAAEFRDLGVPVVAVLGNHDYHSDQQDLAVHGHAHAGTEKGVTAGGTRVRNVAQPVLRSAYGFYAL